MEIGIMAEATTDAISAGVARAGAAAAGVARAGVATAGEAAAGEAGRRVRRALVAGILAATSVACGSTPDLAAWRDRAVVVRASSERDSLERDLETVETLRRSGQLEASRRLALTLAAEHPDDMRTAFVASRAESDEVIRLGDREKSSRDAAAWSALDFARRAIAAHGSGAGGEAAESAESAESAEADAVEPPADAVEPPADAVEPPAELLAQYAYAMGAATHLRGMFARAGHARATLRAIERALDRDPDHPVALATRATLELRLATLPWIAKTMAFGAPDGSVERAVIFARRAADRRPSIEMRLLLAKALRARGGDGDTEEARAILRDALDASDRYPRDASLRPEAASMLASLGAG